jgi:hypothetical protein
MAPGAENSLGFLCAGLQAPKRAIALAATRKNGVYCYKEGDWVPSPKAG